MDSETGEPSAISFKNCQNSSSGIIGMLTRLYFSFHVSASARDIPELGRLSLIETGYCVVGVVVDDDGLGGSSLCLIFIINNRR